MASGKQHITLEGFSTAENFAPKGGLRSPPVPLRDREQHGQHLAAQYDALVQAYQERRNQIGLSPITEDLGIYVEITSFPRVQLSLDSLDTNDFKLYSCRKTDEECEVAVVFIPGVRRRAFLKKLEHYFDPEKDSVQKFVHDSFSLDYDL